MIYNVCWSTMRFLLGLLEAGQRTKLLPITRTMTESFITDALTCVFITVTRSRCPRSPLAIRTFEQKLCDSRLAWLASVAHLGSNTAAQIQLCHSAAGQKMQHLNILRKFSIK